MSAVHTSRLRIEKHQSPHRTAHIENFPEPIHFGWPDTRDRPGADRAVGEGAGLTYAGWLTSPAQRTPTGRRGRTRCSANRRSTSPSREVGGGQHSHWLLRSGGHG